MYNQPVSLTRMTLNISAPAEQGVTLSDSEIVRAAVQSVKEGGLITLLLKGSVIEALSEVTVKAGENLFLQVDGFREGKAYLKILNSADLEQAQNRTLSSNLIAMGIPSKTENVMMARTLLNNNLPVTPQTLGELGQTARMLGGINAENLPIAAFALSRGIQLNPHSLAALQQFLNNPSQAAELTRSILGNLGVLQSSFSVDAVSDPDLGEMLLPGKTAGETEPKTPSAGKEYGMVRSADSLSADKVPFSTQLPPDTAEGKAAGKADHNQDQVKLVSREIQTAVGILREIIENIVLKPALQGQEMDIHLRHRIAGDKDVLRDLFFIKEFLSKNTETLKNPVLKELVQKTEALEKELGGQRIYNSAVGSGADHHSGYYYLSFPVQINNAQQLCELRLQSEAGYRDLKQQDNIKVVVSLDTAGMGIVLFHVNWFREGRIELQGVVENPGVQQFLENNLNQLLHGLTQLGYQVLNLGLKLAESSAEKERLKSTLMAPGGNCTLLAIDITI